MPRARLACVVPEDAQRRIDRFVAHADTALPGTVAAIWVGGSLALGDFQRHSDVDLLVATTRPTTPAERIRVRGVDAEWTELGTPPAAVTAATIHRHGIIVRGPEPRDIVPDVDHATLAAIVRANVRSYWVPWLAAARWTPASLHPRRIEWGVFGVPRILVTIAEGRIVSKTAGALALRDRIDSRWHRILDEAVRLRRGEPSVYRSAFSRRHDMLAFVAHAITLA